MDLEVRLATLFINHFLSIAKLWALDQCISTK